MKKFLALLSILLLAAVPAMAEYPYALTEEAATAAVLQTICTFLDEEGFTYDMPEGYDMCSLSFNIEKPSVLGEFVFMDAFAMFDGTLICAYYEQSIPKECEVEIIRLCNYFNTDTYGAKLYLDPADLTLCCETYMPFDASDISDYDRFMVSESFWLAYGFMEYYHDYFLEVILNGESAANTYAMWVADSE